MSQEIEKVDEVLDEIIDEPTDEPVDEPADKPVDEPTDEPTEEPIDWQARAIKAEGLIQKNKKRAKIEKKEVTQDDPDRIERLELQVEGYPKEIVDEIMELGGRDFLKNKVGKGVVDEMVRQHKAEQAAGS